MLDSIKLRNLLSSCLAPCVVIVKFMDNQHHHHNHQCGGFYILQTNLFVDRYNMNNTIMSIWIILIGSS